MTYKLSRLLTVGIVYFVAFAGFSQGTTCAGATNLPVNTTCVNQSFSNDENGTSPEFVASCATSGSSYEDVWYTVTGTGNPITVTVSGTDQGYALAALTSCAGGELACDQQASGVTGSVTFNSTLGTTYYIHIQRRSGNNNANMSGNICAVSTGGAGGCSADLTIGSTTYSNSGLTTCGAGDDYTSTDACGSSYMDGDDYVIEYTPTTTECIQIALTNTGSWVGIFLTDNCPDAGGTSCLASATNSSGNPSLSYSVTAGTTYYLTISTWPSPQCTAFDIDISACPPPPANDECSGAFPVTVNPDNLCGSTTAGTLVNATTSPQANGCGGTADDDVWFSFVATGTTHTVDLINITGGTTDLYHSVYAGSCGSPGTALVCSDPNTSSISGLTPGNTYFVRVYSWTSTPGQSSSFDVCIGTPPPPPSNDECSGAISVPVSSSGCTPTTGSIYSATPSAQTSGCGGTANDDVWYSFVATTTDVQIDVTFVSGSTSDLYHSVYSGTCGSIGTPVVCSDPNTSTVSGLIPGNTYYVRIYSWSSSAGATTVFDLCISEIGPCGSTSTTEDYCPFAAILTQGPGSWSSSTYPYYTSDTPGNINSAFCGSIENNSWYQFTAQSSTEVFDFTAVNNCVSGWGIQAQVYEVTYDAGGCCNSFTSMSNCFNPATQVTGTVTATGLTPGNQYLLMVDGNAGDNCDFTVSNWTATGIILPVELSNFDVLGMDRENVLSWQTLSEYDNDYFAILRSFDGENFEKIGEVKGAGNSTETINYTFIDKEIRSGIVYYKLGQYDINGQLNESKTVSLNRTSNRDGILAIWPNPANEVIFVEINNDKPNTSGTVQLLDSKGNVIQQKQVEEKGLVQLDFEISELTQGMYFVVYIDENGHIDTRKVIKK